MMLKSSWKKLKGLTLCNPRYQNHSSNNKRVHNHPHHQSPSAKLLDDFTQASKDMQDMKKCNDTILNAAAAAENSAFVFTESLREMGTCLHEQGALNDDEQIGNVLQMLSKVQFELQELVDGYRENEKSRFFKGEAVSPQQLQSASEEYEREAICYVFRLKSLKEVQTQSFVTQAVQHHAAQINLFSKGLKSLEAIDPQVILAAEHQYNDYKSSDFVFEDIYGERRASLSNTGKNLRRTLAFKLRNHEKGLRDDKNESNINRASNKLPSPPRE
ncbi:uncharacterized protein At2g33490-like [Papaver somniferum]|uniref:uncharacterized protein At2g33490-like n=1 Tax=Papaver somniferum TaxID=3469 RepID=UPI000E7018B3|nr:uncharacterized protein At2g33490-like [Papaver somniferum]